MFVASSAVLFALLALLALLLGWTVSRAWPLVLVVLGAAGLVSSFGSRGRVATGYLVSSFGFVVLGAVFSQFSFGIADIGFRGFVLSWWPGLVVAGFACLVMAYLYSKYRRTKSGKTPSP